MKTSFQRLAGVDAILTAIFGLLYALSFIVLKNDLLSALFLLLSGLLATTPLVALYFHLRQEDHALALWGLLFAIAGVLGSAIHAGYDLSNAIHPPANLNTDLPNPVDPRGLMTFGVAAVGIFTFAWLMVRSGIFSRGLGYLGLLSAILMLLLYIGRLVILNAANPVIAIPALLEGFLVSPIWYLWLGLLLLRRRDTGILEVTETEVFISQ